MKGSARRARGFTLLEILIALALVAVIMTLLLGSIRVGAGLWAQGERKADAAARLLTTENFFRTYLSDALPLRETPKSGTFQPALNGSRLLFGGGSRELEFVGVLPPQVRGGLYKFRLHWAEDGERSDLILSLRPFAAADDAEPIEDVTVLEDIEDLRFSYYRRAAVETEPSEWVEAWGEDYLPALVRVEIALRGEAPWPPLLIAPRMETRR
jgi:general secretion pathway protein J